MLILKKHIKIGGNVKRFLLIILSCILFVIFSISCATAPPGPPPSGKVWHKAKGKWILVPAPLGPGKHWVPGHYAPNGRWIPGHWR
jgi:hypothetical protein